MKNSQRGSVIVGIIIGVVLGLAAALAVAVYVTKVPVLPEQGAKAARPNRTRPRRARTATGTPTRRCTARTRPSRCRRAPGVVAPAPAGRDHPRARHRRRRSPAPQAGGKALQPIPLGDLAARARTAPRRPTRSSISCRPAPSAPPEDAEAQRAKLSLMGIEAKVTEREQSGPPGVPRAGRPLRQEGRRRPAEGKAGSRRRRNRAGARAALSPESPAGTFRLSWPLTLSQRSELT